MIDKRLVKTFVYFSCCFGLFAVAPTVDAQYSASERMNRSNREVEDRWRVSLPWILENDAAQSRALHESVLDSQRRIREANDAIVRAREEQLRENKAERAARNAAAQKAFEDFMKDDLTPNLGQEQAQPPENASSSPAPTPSNPPRAAAPKRSPASAPKGAAATAPKKPLTPNPVPVIPTPLTPSPQWGVENPPVVNAPVAGKSKVVEEENRKSECDRILKKLAVDMVSAAGSGAAAGGLGGLGALTGAGIGLAGEGARVILNGDLGRASGVCVPSEVYAPQNIYRGPR